MHALTGCDTVSAMSGRGKLSAFKSLRKTNYAVSSLSKLGQRFQLSADVLDGIEQFVCQLYGGREAHVNELRYSMFCNKRGAIESQNLPPCQDALRKHIQRANYQAGVWIRALECYPEIPPPELHGWSKIIDSQGKPCLVIDWLSIESAPSAILELMSCNCTRQCVSSSCCCLKNGLKCTDMCKIQTCSNYKEVDFDVEVDPDDVDVDLDEDE
jgi:hypothetical protein